VHHGSQNIPSELVTLVLADSSEHGISAALGLLESCALPDVIANDFSPAATAAIATLIVASIFLPITLKILLARNVVDIPNERSLHSAVTPRGGGIALAFGFTAGLLVVGPFSWPIWLSTLGYAGLGAWDDHKSRSAHLRLILQTLIATASSLWLVLALNMPLFTFVIGALILVCSVNAVNFMDGINGISALHAIVWGIAYGFFFWLLELPEYIPLATILAAIGIAFLPWNIPRARLFLGDSGSYLIGGAVGSLALLGLLASAPLAAICPLAIYAADTGAALARRLRAGEKLTQAHKTHVFQQLVVNGWSHSRAATTTAIFTALTAGLGILSLGRSPLIQSFVLVMVFLICTLYLQLPRRLRNYKARTVEGD